MFDLRKLARVAARAGRRRKSLARLAHGVAPGVRRFASVRRGNIAVIAALAAPAVIGALGLGAETGLWYYQQSRLQQAADLAAYAGASEKTLGASHSQIRAAALAEAARNGWNDAVGDSDVNLPPQSGTHQDSNSVEVLLTRDVPRAFSGIFVTEPVHLRARGVATTLTQSAACMLALSPDGDQALLFQGNAEVTLTGCSVMSNSDAVDAIYVNGSVVVSTECAYAVGGVDVEGNGELILTQCADPQEQVAPVADPYADVPWGTIPSGACQAAPPVPLPNVKYCSIHLKATTALAPGDYFVDGGNFKITGNGTITGAGVTFHLMNGSTADFSGTAQVVLLAPTSGPRAGMLFMSNSTVEVNKINGTVNSTLTGVLYFPQNEVEFLGNFSGLGGCMQIVADEIEFEGSTDISVDCSVYGIDEIPTSQYAQLVE